MPTQTLRDRVLGKVDVDNVTVGGTPLFEIDEEARLAQHIKDIATIGYGYTRAEVINLASEYAVLIGKRDKECPLTHRWFYGFLSRWPELKVQRPKTLSELRSYATSPESIARYFHELGRILNKYGLTNKPQNIYNVDEKGVQQNFKPTHVVSSASHVPSVITSERSSTTTILGCGNAIGHQIPPFFVFAGARMRDELLEGSCTGAQGTVSKSGWSNSTVFFDYLQNHFVHYAKPGSDDHILLLYDGHRSHISPYLVDWAKDNNIILFVLPPHTSHILQPLDVGCFGAFSKIYSDECQKHQRNTGSVVGRYNVCSIACKAYTKGLSPANLQSSFRKSGIYPFNPSAIGTTVFEADRLRNDFQQDSTMTAVPEADDNVPTIEPDAEVWTAIPVMDDNIMNIPTLVQDAEIVTVAPSVEVQTSVPTIIFPPTVTVQESTPVTTSEVVTSTPAISAAFFKKKRPVFVPPVRKERRSVSKVVAGKAITEVDVSTQLNNYFADSQKRNKSKFQTPLKSTGKQGITSTAPVKKTTKRQNPKRSTDIPKKANVTLKTSENNVNSQNKRSCESPKAGTSGVSDQLHVYMTTDSDAESETCDTDLCCVCGKLSPEALRRLPYVEFVEWGECIFPSCGHWVHLKYCCPIRALRCHSKFYCPCHGLPWLSSEE